MKHLVGEPTGTGVGKMTINGNQAYIAVRPNGFVDGACFTESADTETWKLEMKVAGFDVEIRDRSEAKAILFTNITPASLLA